MSEIKLACIDCHIVIFSFGVILLTIFGMFTMFDFTEFRHPKIAQKHSKLIIALIYWVPAFLHLGSTIGLIILKKKMSKQGTVIHFPAIHDKPKEEIILQDVIKEKLPNDELISFSSSEEDNNNSKSKIRSIN